MSKKLLNANDACMDVRRRNLVLAMVLGLLALALYVLTVLKVFSRAL